MYFYSEKRLVSKIPSSFHFLGLEKREGSVQKIYAVQAVKKQLYLGESERKFRKVNRGTRKLGSKSPSSMVGSELNLSAHERRRTIDLTCLIEAFSYRRRRLFSLLGFEFHLFYFELEKLSVHHADRTVKRKPSRSSISKNLLNLLDQPG